MRRAASHLPGLVASLLIAAGPAARAEGVAPRACIAAAEDGQLARYHGKLRSAREAFVRCARPECPDPIHSDCLRWLAEVDTSLPSVVLSAEWSDAGDDASARDVLGLEVTVDGEPVANATNGRAVSVDPGEHVIVFTSAGAIPETMKVVIRQGEKNRALRASLAHVEPPRPSAEVAAAGSTARPVPLASWILGGLGVAAVADGVVWYVVGRDALDDQRASCVHDCSSSAVDAERRKLLVGDISVAAGLVSLGAATYLYVRRPELARTLAALPRLDVSAGPTGGRASIRIDF
jgi:hypothetical protein